MFSYECFKMRQIANIIEKVSNKAVYMSDQAVDTQYLCVVIRAYSWNLFNRAAQQYIECNLCSYTLHGHLLKLMGIEDYNKFTPALLHKAYWRLVVKHIRNGEYTTLNKITHSDLVLELAQHGIKE